MCYLTLILCMAFAFVLGSIPFGLVIAKTIKGIDPRKAGSGNIGSTNVARLCGWPCGVLTLFCDIMKGTLPVLIAVHVLPDQFLQSLVALAAVMGHIKSPFLGFKGGKGVATTAGCMFAFSLTVGLSILATWIVMMVLTRYVSLSSMVAGLVLVLTAAWEFWWQDGALSVADGMALALLFVIFALVVYKHRSNIVRLCNGTEPKAFSKKSK